MAKVGRLVKDMIVQELSMVLKDRPSFFVTSLGPLQAVEADGLRKRLRGANARMVMVKRTLGLRGITGVPADDIKGLFSGSVALVLPGEDIIPAAKLLVDFAKANQEKVSVRGGWVDGQLLDAKRFEQYANLPSKPQLIADVIGGIEAPLANLIFTIESVLGELPWILEEAGKKQLAATTTDATPQA